MKKWIVGRASTSAVVFLVLIFLTNQFCEKVQQEEQNYFASELLTHAEQISSHLVKAIGDVKSSDVNNCSDLKLNTLRKITRKYTHVYDLGLVADNKVFCTANWGKLSYPSSLPPRYYLAPSGIELYSSVPGLFPVNQSLDVNRYKNIVAFTDPLAFRQFTNKESHFSYEIKTTSRNHVFLAYDSGWQKNALIPASNLNTTLCSKTYSYCVYTYNKRAGIFYYSPYTYPFIILLCFFVSLLVSYSWQSYFEKRNSMEFRLRKAIKKRKLYMEYQPILSVKTGKIIGVESLIRWHDHVYGMVSPELLLNIATELGLYPEVAYHSVTAAIKSMAPILEDNRDFYLAINVDAFEIQSEEYLDFLMNMLKVYDIKPYQIKIEITERIKLPLRNLADFSTKAKTYGFQISLDDFGTGLANLVWLTEIDFDIIKIDRVFTHSLTNDLKKNFVLSILNMISRLEKQVIFEGVETQAEYGMITAQDETASVQGWYFYKSLPKEEIVKLIHSQTDAANTFDHQVTEQQPVMNIGKLCDEGD